ncbi:MAG: DNA repair protein [Clostridia bacterium]|nr:DNA repair protein [Clostridia bacterium]
MEQEYRYLCIDLKSFYASVECVERGLDPFRTNLVVADPDRGNGTICLAVSPAMKALGVPGRCRLFEIPRGISYITARPRMRLYLEKSSEIVGIYLRHVAPDDLYVYSIDEVFIDVGGYLRMYRKTPKEFANMLRDAVFEQTGICATAGIGTNMFLAKVALDILAKHVPDHIGVLDEAEFRKQLWHHRPITDIWNIGKGTARKLERMGVYDLYGVTQIPESAMVRAFGVHARYLMDHARGIEPCEIADIRSYVPASESMSSSQVLFRDYDTEEAEVVLMEIVDSLAQDLLRKRMMTGVLSLSVGYSEGFSSYASHTRPSETRQKLAEYTSSRRTLTDWYRSVYRKTAVPGTPVRRLAISFGDLISEEDRPPTLFGEPEETVRERKLMQSVLDLQDRYGKNAVLRGRDLESCATLVERNRMIGGHRA